MERAELVEKKAIWLNKNESLLPKQQFEKKCPNRYKICLLVKKMQPRTFFWDICIYIYTYNMYIYI